MRDVIEWRADELADERRHDNQHGTRRRHHPGQPANRDTGRTHDDELTVVSQRTETEERADQRRDRTHLE